MNKNEYYNGADILNADEPINFCVGNRSAGKSYYWKRYCVKRFIQAGEQFIYIRRRQADIDMAMPTFFEDIGNEFPGWHMEYKAGVIYLGFEDENVSPVGYAFALSMLHKVKSMPLEKVVNIIYDEFIPDNGQYLKPTDPAFEPQMLLSLYMTVARGYNKPIRDEVKIICIANLVSMYNPYFSFFGIDMTDKKKFHGQGVFCELFKNNAVSDEIRKSKIGAVLDNTRYGEYALDNKALADSNRHVIDKIPLNVRPWFCLYVYNWYMFLCDDLGRLYVRLGYDKTMKYKYFIIPPPDDNTAQNFRGDVVKACRAYYDRDAVYYLTGAVKSVIEGIIQ